MQTRIKGLPENRITWKDSLFLSKAGCPKKPARKAHFSHLGIRSLCADTAQAADLAGHSSDLRLGGIYCDTDDVDVFFTIWDAHPSDYKAAIAVQNAVHTFRSFLSFNYDRSMMIAMTATRVSINTSEKIKR